MNIPALATVFGIAFFSFFASIPAGVALGIDTLLVGITSTISYAAGVAAVLIVGAPLRERLLRHINKPAADGSTPKPSRTMQLIHRAWERFGLVGLALAAPMTVGAQIGAVVGLSFGANPVRLFIAMTLGAALWSILLLIAINAGLVTLTAAR